LEELDNFFKSNNTLKIKNILMWFVYKVCKFIIIYKNRDFDLSYSDEFKYFIWTERMNSRIEHTIP